MREPRASSRMTRGSSENDGRGRSVLEDGSYEFRRRRALIEETVPHSFMVFPLLFFSNVGEPRIVPCGEDLAILSRGDHS